MKSSPNSPSSNNNSKNVVIVNNDPKIHEQITSCFEENTFNIISFFDCHSFVRQSFSTGKKWDVVLIDYYFGHIKSIEFIKKVKQSFPSIPIILLTPQELNEEIVRVAQEGDFDYIAKPIHSAQLQLAVDKALSDRTDFVSNHAIKPSHASIDFNSSGYLIGKSPKFIAALDIAKRVAPSAASIVLFGESGTGKEVFANYIHEKSKRRNGPFIAINCSSVPENLLESEFFGHAKGSFTGAIEKRIGLFEAAENGTLFLDEIGDLSLSLQAKLLRVLQEKKIKRVGENTDIKVNCRIISATHKDLALEVQEGRFREDLFFRLNVIPIALPPLRERKEDLLLLANSFLKKFVIANDSKARAFSKEATEFIVNNPWRGNVRELENSIERAVILSRGHEILLEDFLPKGACRLEWNSKSLPTPSESEAGQHIFSVEYIESLPSLNDIINQYISYAIKINGGAKDKTAKEIGIDRKTLYKRMQNSVNK